MTDDQWEDVCDGIERQKDKLIDENHRLKQEIRSLEYEKGELIEKIKGLESKVYGLTFSGL